MGKENSFDAIIVGSGLAALVAAAEIADAGKTVVMLDQEGEQGLGGQAFWSLGGLFLVDTPEQRRLGIRDSHELASRDWFTTAGFDRPDDHWPRKWADAYLELRRERNAHGFTIEAFAFSRALAFLNPSSAGCVSMEKKA